MTLPHNEQGCVEHLDGMQNILILLQCWGVVCLGMQALHQNLGHCQSEQDGPLRVPDSRINLNLRMTCPVEPAAKDMDSFALETRNMHKQLGMQLPRAF